MITLPGLIDPHVHFRTPGQTQKEDFYTGTQAALAGGYTTVIDMPNNLEPITTENKLVEKIAIAKKTIVCDVGFHFGSVGENFDQFSLVQNEVLGLKIYLNQTTGGFIVDETVFTNICEAWPKDKPILVHAEENVIEQIIEIGHTAQQRIHVCHVSSQKELQAIITAKMKGYAITCGVTPHHLFLTSSDEIQLGAFARMNPKLKTKADVDFLWQHLRDIDVIESDHAPHTLAEKNSENPPFGVPGLETTLPLLLTAMHDKKISIEEIKRLCYTNPKKIFLENKSFSHSERSEESSREDPSVSPQDDTNTYIEIDEQEEWTIQNENLFTKCKWSPFNGWDVVGRVKRVFLRGTKVFEDGKILALPGSGKVLGSTVVANP